MHICRKIFSISLQVGFDKGNKIDNAEYPISRSYQMGNIADYSNVGIPGRIVTRIDGTVVLKGWYFSTNK